MQQTIIRVGKVLAHWPLVGPCVRYIARIVGYPRPASTVDLAKPAAESSLLASLPVTLRHLTRELRTLRADLDRLAKSVESLQRGQGQAAPTPSDQPSATAATILSPDKLTAARQRGLRLAFGTDAATEGDIVVEQTVGPGVDVVVNTLALPFELAAANAITVGRWLEQHTAQTLRDTVLPGLYLALKPGGELVVRARDAATFLQPGARATLTATCPHGAAHSPEPATLFTRQSLEALLAEAGFVGIQAQSGQSPLALVARKPP